MTIWPAVFMAILLASVSLPASVYIHYSQHHGVSITASLSIMTSLLVSQHHCWHQHCSTAISIRVTALESLLASWCHCQCHNMIADIGMVELLLAMLSQHHTWCWHHSITASTATSFLVFCYHCWALLLVLLSNISIITLLLVSATQHQCKH